MKQTLTRAQLEASKEILVEFAIRKINWQGLRGTHFEKVACHLAWQFTIMELD